MFDAGEGVVDVVGAYEFETLLGHVFAESGVFEDFDETAGDGGGVVGAAEISGFVVFDEFGDGAGADGDGG